MSNIDLTLLPDFIVEASEHLDEMELLLLQLVDNPGDIDILNEVFRPAHTIKGAAQFMGIEKIARLTHRLEDLLDQLRAGERESSQDIVEVLMASRDRILLLVAELEETQQEESGIDDLINKLNVILDLGDNAQSDIDEDSIDQSSSGLAETDQLEQEQPESDLPAEFDEVADDQELFEIFFNHLQQQVTRLVTLIAGFDDASDKDIHLDECIDALNKLRSSANYMGYDEIGDFYQGWIDALIEAKKSVSLGRDVAFSFMDFYLGELKQNYPQLDYSAQSSEEEEADDAGIEDMLAELKQMSVIDDEAADSFEQSMGSQTEAGQLEKTQPVSPMEEESDQELFEIYLNHLQQQVTQLISLMAGLDNTSDRVNQADQCIESINSLRSSANYMGYDETACFYQSWIATLDEAKKSLAAGRDVVFTFMDFFLGVLKRDYPQIDYSAHSLPEPETVSVSAQQSDDDYNPEIDDLEAILQASAQLEEEDLFSRLTSALDGSIHQVSDTEYETLHGVYDEIVSPQQEQDGAAKVAEKKPEPPKERRKVDQRLDQDDRRKEIDRRGIKKDKQASKQKRSLRVDSVKIDSLMNQVGELVVDRSYFIQLLNELGGLQQHLKEAGTLDQKETKMLRTFNYRLVEAISALGRTSNDLQEGVMKMRMIPISQIFNRYPRLIHDLTRNTDKTVNLVVRGEETELDKMIVEEISDPLVHIIRNAVDHGIESLDERMQKGKKEKATLILEAYHESNNIIIEVTDDGRGLDLQKIKNKAVEKGLYSEDELEQMTPKEVSQIITVAGFSTADKITGTSGRGVGMDVVRQNIEKLNGTLDIETKLGVGTQMRLKIPLTLAIIHALMVRTGADVFAIPLANVDETVRVKVDEISTVEGVEVIYLRGQTLPIFRLSSLFNIESDKNSGSMFVVIVSSNNQRTGFVIDELLRQEEVVIKPMVDYVQDKSGFSGATIIGDGRISLILDVFELVRITARQLAKKQNERATYLKSQVKKKKLPSRRL